MKYLCQISDLSQGLRGHPIVGAGEAGQVHRGEHGGRGPARRWRRPGARAGRAPRAVAALQDAAPARRQRGHRGVPPQRGQKRKEDFNTVNLGYFDKSFNATVEENIH